MFSSLTHFCMILHENRNSDNDNDDGDDDDDDDDASTGPRRDSHFLSFSLSLSRLVLTDRKDSNKPAG